MWHKLKEVAKLGLPVAVYTLLLELFEEALEELIAWSVSLVITKVISVVFVITLTQAIKLIIKKTIKLFTYKGGYDKMEKLKEFFQWLFANKKSTLATIGNAGFAGIATAGIWSLDGIPPILVNGFDIAPIIYTIIVVGLAAVVELGICGKGFEQVKDFFARIAVSKEAKAVAKAEKQAKAEEEKKAKALAKEQAEIDAKAIAELKAEKIRARVEELKREEATKNAQ